MVVQELVRNGPQHMAQNARTERVTFQILGQVRALRDGVELEVGPPQHQAILALLMAHAGRHVSVDELVEAVWGQAPPSTAVNLVHRAIGALRRLLQPELPVRVTGRYLLRAGTGYRLLVSADTLDLLQFRLLLARARQAGDPAAASALYLRALDLWQGPCGQDLSLTAGRPAAFTAIDREHLAAVRDAADAAVAAGVAKQVLSVLRAAAASDGLDEPLQARLMQALEASGHRAEAFSVYHEARERLATELGVDPGDELRAAYDKLLHSESVSAQAGARSAPVVSPAQLPTDLPVFAGRIHEVARVCASLASAAETDSMVISVIDGMAGVGKTTLAVHCGHKMAGQFPDGQLYVDLRGFDLHGSVLEPGAALRGFLEALGTPAERVPATLQGQAALYRSLLAGHRVLVVLDNARDVEQVRPLLPATAGCAVIITSRNCFTGLAVSHGAVPTTLEVLSTDEAREAMERRLGRDRVRAEPDAIEEIAQSCGRLPLALAVVAGRAITHEASSLASIATELQIWQGSLEAFAGSDPQTDVRNVFSWSYKLLSPAAARVFRLLSAHSGPDISLSALASLSGLSQRDARALVNELTEARLLLERQPGRYLMHDLIRAYARDLSSESDTEDDRDEARGRAMDHYLHTAYAASTVLRPYRGMACPGTPRPGVTAEAPTQRTEIYAWYTAEYHVLLTAVREAADFGFSQDACQLALAMQDYLQSMCYVHDWESIMRTVIAGAERIGDRASAAWARRSLAGALVDQHRYEEAAAELRHTVEQFDELGYQHEHAYLQTNLGVVASLRGKQDEAIEHLQRARTLHATGNHAHGVGRAVLEMATCHSRLGRDRESIALAEEALAIFTTLNQPNAMADCLLALGTAQGNLGEFVGAVRSLQRAAELWRCAGIPTGEATALMHLAGAWLEVGDQEAARAARQQALALDVGLFTPEAEAIRARLDQVAWSPTAGTT